MIKKGSSFEQKLSDESITHALSEEVLHQIVRL
jgi:hypothetical protein